MAKREEIIRTANADVFVSVHQNFFEQGAGAAAPRFFTATGKRRATSLRNMSKGAQRTARHRKSARCQFGRLPAPAAGKPGQYHCGMRFFSIGGGTEAAKDDYQQAVAQAVGSGIETYLLKKIRKGGGI